MSSDLKEIGAIVSGRGVNDKGPVRDAGAGVVCVGVAGCTVKPCVSRAVMDDEVGEAVGCRQPIARILPFD